MFMCESPRWDYRKGRIDRARTTIAKSYGVSQSHIEVVREMNDIRLKYEAETEGGPHPWYEIFTGPRMAYRTLLGITLQAMQQLTGANYFFVSCRYLLFTTVEQALEVIRTHPPSYV